jgi:membrane-associated phospholipid phosphatase
MRNIQLSLALLVISSVSGLKAQGMRDLLDPGLLGNDETSWSRGSTGEAAAVENESRWGIGQAGFDGSALSGHSHGVMSRWYSSLERRSAGTPGFSSFQQGEVDPETGAMLFGINTPDWIYYNPEMTTGGWIASGALTAAFIGIFTSGDEELMVHTGDILQLLVPTYGYALSAFEPTWEGAGQQTLVIGSQLATVGIVKGLAEKWRPDGSSQSSFPSGHTAGAFSGASYTMERYGPALGIPAVIGGLATGYSRINAQKHFTDDVLAGASTSLFYGLLWVSKNQKPLPVQPMMGNGVYGLRVKLEASDPVYEEAIRVPTWQEDKKVVKRRKDMISYVRYELEFGGVLINRNEVKSPRDTGTAFDMSKDFDDFSNPTTSAAGNINWVMDQVHELGFRFAPFEVRDEGRVTQTTNFGNKTYTAHTPMVSRYLMFTYDFRYRYEFVPKSDWQLKLGGMLSIQDFAIELAYSDGTSHERVSDLVLLPLLHAHVGYNISDDFLVYVEGEGISFGHDKSFEAIGKFQWNIDENWDIGLGYRYVARDIETDRLVNNLRMDQVILSAAYTW